VQFTTDRITLNFLEKDQPALSYIATSLLRMYGSIFHYPTVIREFEVSKMMRIEKEQLDRGLQKLAALGVIEYRPAIAGGTLYWMHNRFAPAHLRIDMGRINKLRVAHEERVAAMIKYIEEEHVCRNILLSAYFGEQNDKPCGGCDACKRNARQAKPVDLKEKLLAVIREKQQVSLQELSQLFPDVESSLVVSSVRDLNDESLCRVYPTGIIFAT
jgi:ATP-dependent DNA helicase RecQ